jgi:hypothetical protein
VGASNADLVRRLESPADQARADPGDGATSAEGANCRPVGLLADAKPLVTYVPAHPYIIAMYDSADRE